MNKNRHPCLCHQPRLAQACSDWRFRCSCGCSQEPGFLHALGCAAERCPHSFWQALLCKPAEVQLPHMLGARALDRCQPAQVVLPLLSCPPAAAHAHLTMQCTLCAWVHGAVQRCFQPAGISWCQHWHIDVVMVLLTQPLSHGVLAGPAAECEGSMVMMPQLPKHVTPACSGMRQPHDHSLMQRLHSLQQAPRYPNTQQSSCRGAAHRLVAQSTSWSSGRQVCQAARV